MTLISQQGATGTPRGADIAIGGTGAVSGRLRYMIGTLPIYALFFVLIGLPLLTVLAQSVMPALFDPVAPSFVIDPSPLFRAFASVRVDTAILHSLELGAAVGVTSTILGGVFAILTQRFVLPLRWLITPVPWLVFLTPAYLKAMAWVLMMAPNGYLAQLGLLSRPMSDAFFGIGGLVFVHTLSLFPLSAFIIGGALAGLGGDVEDAARLAGARPLRIWLRINLPLLAPALALSAIATFAEVLSDFGLATTIAKTSGFGVLTYGIYVAASDYPIDFPMAGAQSLILLALILTVVMADRLLRRQGSFRLISGRSRTARVYDTGRARWPMALAALLIAVLALYLPMVIIFLRTFTATLGHGLETSNFTMLNVIGALSPGAPASAALVRSLVYATFTALISAGIALILSARLDQAGPNARAVVMGLSIGSIAIPGIVLGFGYILVWNRLPGFRDWPFPHYGQPSLLVVGYVATALPYCLVVILSAVGQLAPSLDDAARLHGATRLTRLLRITLPLVLLSVVTALLLTFIRTMFELPVSQLLIPQNGSPVPTYVVRLLKNDDDGPASALALVAMVTAGGLAGGLWRVAQRFLTFGGRAAKRTSL